MPEKLRIRHLLESNPKWVDIFVESFATEERFREERKAQCSRWLDEAKIKQAELASAKTELASLGQRENLSGEAYSFAWQLEYRIKDLQQTITRLEELGNTIITWHGFEWHEVHAQPAVLNKMVVEKILNVQNGGRHKCYKLADPGLVREVVIELHKGESEESEEENRQEIPDDIFSPVIGYDDIKQFLTQALQGKKRLHFLLEGTPATAKSLFMLCIQQAFPQTYYATGSRTTAPGLTDALKTSEPEVLLLDEIEKCDMQSYAVLLSLMESGMVVETKHRRHTSTRLNTIVIGSCNSSHRLPPELLSRFDFHLQLKAYSKDEFIQVCTDYLSRFENVPEKWAESIGKRVWDSPKIPSDIRKARGVARILDAYDQKAIDEVINFEEKYSR